MPVTVLEADATDAVCVGVVPPGVVFDVPLDAHPVSPMSIAADVAADHADVMRHTRARYISAP
jgi:hypothetical protein